MAKLIWKDTMDEEEVVVLAMDDLSMLVTCDGQHTGLVDKTDVYVEWADCEYAKAHNVLIQDYLKEVC